MKPAREHATNNAQTCFVTSKTWESRALFRSEPWARLFFQNLLAHRDSYLLHEFVLMPDHFHLHLTPSVALERAVQFVKGGFSFRLKAHGPVWQPSFSNHRIRNFEDYENHREYIRMNPVRAGLVGRPEKYPYSSAACTMRLDPVPQGLKPNSLEELATRP